MHQQALPNLARALLVAALVAAYANHFHNSFHFDDAHTIVNNAAIRELRNIPLFFRDATTFSALPSNQSYRPLVSTLLAIDYSFGQRPATVLVSLVDLHALRLARPAPAFVIIASARLHGVIRRATVGSRSSPQPVTGCTRPTRTRSTTSSRRRK